MSSLPVSPTPRVISFIRFSTLEQAKGDSLRRQQDDAIDRLLDVAQDTGPSQGIARRLAALEAEKVALGLQRKALEQQISTQGNPLLLRSLRLLTTGQLWASPLTPTMRTELAQRLRTIIASVSLDSSTGLADVAFRFAGGQPEGATSQFRFAFPPQ